MGLPTIITLYLDPARKAVFTRKDFQPVAVHNVEPVVIAVKADGPYKTLKDLIDAANAKPERLSAGVFGLLSAKHLAVFQFEQQTGTRFAVVPFEGGNKALAALLGGHIDVDFCTGGEVGPQVKSGEVRLLGVMDSEENKFFPGVKTLESQGYKIYATATRGWVAPGDTPKETVAILSAAFKRATENPTHIQKMDALSMPVRYMDSAKFAALWNEQEVQVKPLMGEAQARTK